MRDIPSIVPVSVSCHQAAPALPARILISERQKKMDYISFHKLANFRGILWSKCVFLWTHMKNQGNDTVTLAIAKSLNIVSSLR